MKRKLALLLLILPALALADEFKINDLSGGAYTYPSANKIPDNAAAYIQNMYTDIEPVGQERNGYVKRDTTVLGGTKPAYGSWEFLDTSGNDWYITYSSRTFYKNTIGQTPTAFGLVATVDQIPDCAKNIGIIMCVNGTDSAWAFDGASTGTIATAPLGTLIEPWRTRFAIGNIGGAKSTVRFSADGSSSSWTLGGNAGDPFQIQIGGANDGEYIRCLQGSYQDSLIVGRKYDLWGMDGFSQNDAQTRNISRQVGCIESRSMQEVDGELVFLSARGLEAMTDRSIQNISEPIRNITDILVKNTINQRTNTQTSQPDFVAGTISPDNSLSTSISPGNVVLSTMALTSQSDTTAANFSAGTKTQVNTGVASPTGLSLSLQTVDSVKDSAGFTPFSADHSCTAPYYMSQQFLAASTYPLTAMELSLYKVGSPPTTFDFNVLTDSAGAPGVVISSIAIGTAGMSSTFPGATFSFSMSTPYARLLGGTTYWMQLIPTSGAGGCDVSNYIGWGVNSASAGKYNNGVGASLLTARVYYWYFKTKGSAYYSSGNLVSRSFDVGFTTNTWLWNWGIFSSSQSIPSPATTLTYETQSSADNVAFDSLVAVTTGTAPTSIVRRYIRYKASFATSDTSISPVISSVTMSAGPFVSTGGLFTSQIFSVGSLISAWGPVTIGESKSSGTITYQFGSTNTASASAISNWTNIVNGGIPTVSTNPYAAFRSTFVSTTAGSNLSLADFQTTWNEGGVIPAPVSTVYDRRYWISFTTTTGNTPVLDTIMVWQRSKSFVFFKGIYAGSFALWRDKLYFGNSNSTGYVYQFDTGNSDDGSDISSIITTKSYDLGQFLREKDLMRVYVGYLGDSAYTGSFTLTYDLDRSGSSYALGSANLTEGVGQVAAKFPFPLSNPLQGREVQYTLTKSGTGDRLKLYDFLTKFAVKRER